MLLNYLLLSFINFFRFFMYLYVNIFIYFCNFKKIYQMLALDHITSGATLYHS